MPSGSAKSKKIPEISQKEGIELALVKAESNLGGLQEKLDRLGRRGTDLKNEFVALKDELSSISLPENFSTENKEDEEKVLILIGKVEIFIVRVKKFLKKTGAANNDEEIAEERREVSRPVVVEMKIKRSPAIDLSIEMVNEMFIENGKAGELIDCFLRSDNNRAYRVAENIFQGLSKELIAEIKSDLTAQGYTWDDFVVEWKRILHKKVIDTLQEKFDQEKTSRLAQKITLGDKIKANSQAILKQTALVGGVAIGVGTGLGLVAGAAAAFGGAIAGAGVFGRWRARRLMDKVEKAHAIGEQTKEEKEVVEKFKNINENRTEEMIAEIKKEIIKANPEKYVANLFSQAIAGVTVINKENVSGELLYHNLVGGEVRKLAESGELQKAQAKKLEALKIGLVDNNRRRDLATSVNAGQEADKKDSRGVRIVQNFLRAKSGYLFVGEKESNIKNFFGYAAPVAVGTAAYLAIEAGGGAVMESLRMGFGTLAGGFGGYRLGEKMHDQTVNQEFLNKINVIIAKVESGLRKYAQGTNLKGDDIDLLKVEIQFINTYLENGALDSSPLLKMRAEGLIRQAEQRKLYEKEKKKTESETQTQSQLLNHLIDKVKRHKIASPEALKNIAALAESNVVGWRKGVYALLGALGGVAVTFGIGYYRRGDESELMDRVLGKPQDNLPQGVEIKGWAALMVDKFKDLEQKGVNFEQDHPVQDDELVADKGRGNSKTDISHDKQLPEVEKLVGKYTIGRGQGILHATEHFKRDPSIFHDIVDRVRKAHPNWQKIPDNSVYHRWSIEQSRANGFILADDGQHYNKTLMPGAEVTYKIDANGYPRIEIGNKFVSEHGWKFLPHSSATHYGTNTDQLVSQPDQPERSPLPELKPSHQLNQQNSSAFAEQVNKREAGGVILDFDKSLEQRLGSQPNIVEAENIGDKVSRIRLNDGKILYVAPVWENGTWHLHPLSYLVEGKTVGGIPNVEDHQEAHEYNGQSAQELKDLIEVKKLQHSNDQELLAEKQKINLDKIYTDPRLRSSAYTQAVLAQPSGAEAYKDFIATYLSGHPNEDFDNIDAWRRFFASWKIETRHILYGHQEHNVLIDDSEADVEESVDEDAVQLDDNENEVDAMPIVEKNLLHGSMNFLKGGTKVHIPETKGGVVRVDVDMAKTLDPHDIAKVYLRDDYHPNEMTEGEDRINNYHLRRINSHVEALHEMKEKGIPMDSDVAKAVHKDLEYNVREVAKIHHQKPAQIFKPGVLKDANFVETSPESSTNENIVLFDGGVKVKIPQEEGQIVVVEVDETKAVLPVQAYDAYFKVKPYNPDMNSFNRLVQDSDMQHVDASLRAWRSLNEQGLGESQVANAVLKHLHSRLADVVESQGLPAEKIFKPKFLEEIKFGKIKWE